MTAHVKQLSAASLDERRTALQALLGSREPAVIPHLFAALDDASELGDQMRQAIIYGVVQAFPAQAAPALLELCERGSLRQREAATYGLGFVADPRANDALWQAVGNPEQRIRQAAVYSLRQTTRALIREATAYCNHHSEAGPAGGVPLWRRSCERLVAAIAAQEAKSSGVSTELVQLVRRMADARTAQRLQAAYCEKLGIDSALGDLLRRAGRANSRWLGRPQPPEVARVEYQFEMINLVAEKDKAFPIRTRPVDMELLRLDEIAVDRGIRWVMPLDELLLFPAAVAPRLVNNGAPDATSSELTLHYQVPRGASLLVGMGSMNITYWEGRSPVATTGAVVFERQRAVPLRETLYDAAGESVAELEFSGYQALDSGWVPTEVRIEIPNAQPRNHHLRFDLRYRVHDGVWSLVEGRTSKLEGGAVELLALASIRNLVVVSKEPTSRPRTQPK
ncbi:MAG: hypothetical protein AAF581_12325 [Planctomycetota bacterium]